MKSEFLKTFLIISLVLFFALIVFTIVGWQIITIKAQEALPVIVTEIMYDLDGSDASREWVEIYNRGSQAVEIIGGQGATSWRFNDGSNHTLILVQGDLILEPQEVAVIASDAVTFLSEHPDFSGTVIDTVMSLNNSGDTVALSSDAGQTFFAQVNYLSSWGASGNGKTLEKVNLSGDDSQINWQESSAIGGTPGAVSDNNPLPANQPPVAEAGANQTALVNQLVTFDASGSYDPDGSQLTYNWHLGDGNIVQGISVGHSYSNAGNYIVILEVSDGQLFATDTLEVFVQENQAAPTSTNPAPEPETNPEPTANHAPIAEAGEDRQALINEIINFDATNSYNQDNNQLSYFWDFGDQATFRGVTTTHQYSSAESYTVTLTVSDGSSEDQDTILIEIIDNVPISGSSSGNSNSTALSREYSDKIIINEILPNPKGADEAAEYIELFNQGYEAVDLSGWQLQDNSSRVYTIEEGSFISTAISAGGYFVINRKISGISLNNSGGDKVILYQPDGHLLQLVEYTSSALEGKAYARKDNGEWAWTQELSAGKANLFAQNLPPKAVISLKSSEFYVDESIDFDGSLSADPDNGLLNYAWDFGDRGMGDEEKESHTFETTGAFNVILTVTDPGGLADATTKRIKIKALEAANSSNTQNLTEISSVSAINSNTALNVIINEFMPNPLGSDEAEWIELYNNSSEKIDLTSLLLDDIEGGSAPYSLKDLMIEPFGYLVINRTDSNIALNNSSDSVRLLTAEGQVIQEVSYQGAKEEKSYSYNPILSSWFWAETPTQGTENQLPLVNNLQVAGIFSEEPEQKFYSISEIKELEKGTKVITQGAVIAAPNVLGKRIFYIAEADFASQKSFSSPGLEVYMAMGEFPSIAVGDIIELSGKVSEASGKKRINLSKDGRINIIDHWPLPLPESVGTGEASEDLIGSLVSVSGTLLEKKGSNYYLDDGSGEIKVYLKKTAGIKNPAVKAGDWLEISGILDLTSAGYRILPRSSADIQVGRVLGKSELAEEIIDVENSNQGKSIKKYLLWGGGGTLVLLIAALFKKRFSRQ